MPPPQQNHLSLGEDPDCMGEGSKRKSIEDDCRQHKSTQADFPSIQGGGGGSPKLFAEGEFGGSAGKKEHAEYISQGGFRLARSAE
jgi:hypothetical protein